MKIHNRFFAIGLLGLAACASNEGDPTAETTSDDNGGGKADDTQGTLWSKTGPAEFRIEGAFTTAFAAARAGEPDGIFPQPRTKDPFAGVLSYVDSNGRTVKLDVELQVRGNSSLHECDFPKLKVKADKTKVGATMFNGAHKFKIGTHCAEGGNGTIGRLRSQIATWRESLVYDIARAADLATLKTKPVTITYVDTVAHTELKRKAFLLEHIDIAAKRMGGESVADPELFVPAATDKMSNSDIAKAHMLEALVGNWDWNLNASKDANESKFWNVELVKTGQQLTPVPADFDLSSFVTGDWVKASAISELPGVADLHVRQAAHYLVTEAAEKLSRAELLTARDYMKTKKAAIDGAVANAKIDAAGRKLAQAHVAAFFTALESMELALDQSGHP
jgi:hypothetical protein